MKTLATVAAIMLVFVVCALVAWVCFKHGSSSAFELGLAMLIVDGYLIFSGIQDIRRALRERKTNKQKGNTEHA